MKPRIAHIINPVNMPPSSDLYVAQPVTFASMKLSAELAKDVAEVELWTAQYDEDASMIPDYFTQTTQLERSVLDIRSFEKDRKLPLVGDILQKLYDATDAEYLVYTNVDISLMPYFYQSIAAFIQQGYDAFVINRRTVSDTYSKPEELPLMFTEVGKKHPGYDCFVFHRSLFPKLNLKHVIVGTAGIGLTLVGNLMRIAQKFHIFEYTHLTFHLGDDRSWQNKKLNDYQDFNQRQTWEILSELEDEYEAFSENDPGWAYQAFLELKDRYDPNFHLPKPPKPSILSKVKRKLLG